MGFFKKIGSSLKRVISIKNITRAATGQFGAIGKDVLRIASTEDPAEVRRKQAEAQAKGETYTPAVVQPVQMPALVENILDSKGADFNTSLTSKLAQNKVVQDLTSTAVNTGIKAYWQKYKTWIIGFLFALVMFFSLRWVFKKASGSGKRRK